MNKFAMAVATASLLLSSQSQAATIIQDTFWGAGLDGVENTGTNVNLPELSGDVYGEDAEEIKRFDIDSVEATLTQNMLTVVIKSSLYFSSWLDGSTSEAPGDLYLSTKGWTPHGSASSFYNTDDSTNGTDWDFVISLSEIAWGVDSGDAILYKTADGETFYGREYRRTAQEVWFGPNDGTPSIFGTGKWSYQAETNGEISLLISMDMSGLLETNGWDGISALGFHFTMDCGNDVIEGSIAPVPLPSACLLLGSALVGLMGVARRRIR